MFRFGPLLLAPLVLASGTLAQTYSATYLPSNAPKMSEQGQAGTNQCGTGYNQTSMCQNAYVNSLDDFCLFAPPQPGPNSTIGETERIEVAWCIKPSYGTRLIPDGAIQGAHLVETKDYVQITGIGNLTDLYVPDGDEGGELDPHGADGNGNPIGGLVFSSAFGGKIQQAHEWTMFVSDSVFCIRVCKDGPDAPALCNHIYDVMGCYWNMPGNYSAGSFDSCQGDSGEPMGVYGQSTFYQGETSTPSAHALPPTSSCTTTSSIGNGVSIPPVSISTPPPAPASPSASASPSSSSSSPSASSSSTAHKSGAASLGGRNEFAVAGMVAFIIAGIIA